jgi:hypothetical protein
MADLGIFANPDDRRLLLTYLFDEFSVVVYEVLSERDAPLRHFSSLTQLETELDLGRNTSQNFHIHIPGVLRAPEVATLTLKVPPLGFKEKIVNTLWLQLYLERDEGGAIRRSRWAHHEEAGARSHPDSAADRVDWVALRRVSGQIQRHIRNRFAAATIERQVVLPGAFKDLQGGVPIFNFGRLIKDQSEITSATPSNSFKPKPLRGSA